MVETKRQDLMEAGQFAIGLPWNIHALVDLGLRYIPIRTIFGVLKVFVGKTRLALW